MMNPEIYIIVRYPPIFEVEKGFIFGPNDRLQLCKNLLKDNRCACEDCFSKAAYTVEENYPIKYDLLRITPSENCFYEKYNNQHIR